MKKNSPRKKNVSKKRNTPKKKSYPEVNYVTETGASKKINKKRYVKKKKNKVDFIEYLRDIAKDVWDARGSIITVVVILGFFASLHFMTNYNPGNESAICTVTSVEIVEHEDPYWTSGEFETEECGIIKSSKSPDGIPIRHGHYRRLYHRLFWRGPRLLTNTAASMPVDSFLYIHSSHACPRHDG